MRTLIVHNHYRQPGGEDTVFRVESELLARADHAVRTLTAHNEDIPAGGAVAAGVRSVWNREFCARIEEAVRAHRAEVVHFHNTLPIVSPAAMRTARAAGAAVVQTLHNYRLVCPAGLLFRDGEVCEDCVGKRFPWPGVARGC